MKKENSSFFFSIKKMRQTEFLEKINKLLREKNKKIRQSEVLAQLNQMLGDRATTLSTRKTKILPGRFRIIPEKDLVKTKKGLTLTKTGRNLFQWQPTPGGFTQATSSEEMKTTKGIQRKDVKNILTKGFGVETEKLVQSGTVLRVPIQEMPHFKLRPGAPGQEQAKAHFQKTRKTLQKKSK